MEFNINLDNINKRAEQNSADRELKKERQIRTGMSMQQTAMMALNKNIMAPPQQPVNPIQPPKNA